MGVSGIGLSLPHSYGELRSGTAGVRGCAGLVAFFDLKILAGVGLGSIRFGIIPAGSFSQSSLLPFSDLSSWWSL
jgi:hypothetical protein